MTKMEDYGGGRRGSGMVLINLGLLLIVAALGLIGYNRWESDNAGASSAEVLSQIWAEGAGAADGVTSAEGRTDEAGVLAGETGEDTASADGSADGDSGTGSGASAGNGTGTAPSAMPIRTIEGNEYIAVLKIPKLGLELPVMQDWDYEKLKVAPCRYTGSYLEDDLVIAGHAYRSHFQPLHDLAEGDVIFLAGMNGTEYRYTVAEKETLKDTAVEEMTGSDYSLTLFTCTNSGTARLAVRCVRDGVSREDPESGEDNDEE